MLALAGAVLAGCQGVRDTLGINRKGPDEFTVVTKAPLAMPPDFTLRPPEPGAPRPMELDSQRQARAALTGARSAAVAAAPRAGTSEGELAILRRAGAENADPNIRNILREETTLLAERDRAFTDKLIFWKDPVVETETLDAAKEAQRLRENAAAGIPPTAGETPIRARRKRALLE